MSWRALKRKPFPTANFSSQEWRTYITISSLNWGLSAAFIFASSVTMLNSSLGFSLQVKAPSGTVLLLLITLLLIITSLWKDQFFAILLNTVCLIVIVHFSSTLLSYTSQFWAAKVPFRDGLIAGVDSSLGFNWAAWYDWLNAHSLLENALRAVYSYSLPVQLGLLTCVQSISFLEIRMQRLCFVTQMALLITLIMAALVPTLGPYHYFSIPETANASNFFPAATGSHISDIINLRSASPKIPLDMMQGIITFPSFHAEMGLLFVWSVWPVRIMRWAAIAINGLMIIAVPLCGAHYLTDVIGGAAVALAAILIENTFFWFLVFSRAAEYGSSTDLATSGPASDPGM